MCLAVPMTIKSINGDDAVVERDGISTEIKISLITDPQVGDQVLVHAGFAIEKLDQDTASQIETTWLEYNESLDEN